MWGGSSGSLHSLRRFAGSTDAGTPHRPRIPGSGSKRHAKGESRCPDSMAQDRKRKARARAKGWDFAPQAPGQWERQDRGAWCTG